MTRNRQGLKQICFDVPEEWHAKIFKRAKDKNMTMKQWIIKSCLEQLKKEEKLGWE